MKRSMQCAIGLVAICLPVRAESPALIDVLCELHDLPMLFGAAEPSEVVATCTTALNKGNLSQTVRRTLIFKRAEAFLALGKIELAVSDYREVVREDDSNCFARYRLLSIAASAEPAEVIKELEALIERTHFLPFA